jgi:hypothetical protein
MMTYLLKIMLCDGTIEYEFVNENHLKSITRTISCDDKVAKIEVELAPTYN